MCCQMNIHSKIKNKCFKTMLCLYEHFIVAGKGRETVSGYAMPRFCNFDLYHITFLVVPVQNFENSIFLHLMQHLSNKFSLLVFLDIASNDI